LYLRRRGAVEGCVARYREATRILESLAKSVVKVSAER